MKSLVSYFIEYVKCLRVYKGINRFMSLKSDRILHSLMHNKLYGWLFIFQYNEWRRNLLKQHYEIANRMQYDHVNFYAEAFSDNFTYFEIN